MRNVFFETLRNFLTTEVRVADQKPALWRTIFQGATYPGHIHNIRTYPGHIHHEVVQHCPVAFIKLSWTYQAPRKRQKRKTPKPPKTFTTKFSQSPHGSLAMTKISRAARIATGIFTCACLFFVPVRIPPTCCRCFSHLSSPKLTGRNGIFNVYYD